MQPIKDLNEELKRIVKELDEEASKLQINDETDYRIIALRNLSSYISKLFDRLIKNQNAPVEYLAFSSRNLFECYLLTAYIVDDPARAKEFISQKAFDEREINEGFLSLPTNNTANASKNMLKEKIEEINKVFKNHGLNPSKHWTVGYLAQKTNNKEEYDGFFKMYSKYIHPSSWIVNSHEEEYGNLVFKNIFFSQGQIFTNRIVQLIYKFQGK